MRCVYLTVYFVFFNKLYMIIQYDKFDFSNPPPPIEARKKLFYVNYTLIAYLEQNIFLKIKDKLCFDRGLLNKYLLKSSVIV